MRSAACWAVKAITLCLSEENKQRAYPVARIGPSPPMCRDERCDICLGDGLTRVLGQFRAWR